MRLIGLAGIAVISLRPKLRAQGLGQFAAGPPPCAPNEKTTPAAPEGPEFKKGAPRRTSLLDPGVTGAKLNLSGTVAGLTCGPIGGARLDFWQADANGVYDAAGFRLRGHQFTDATGAYRLETIVPGAQKRAPRLHVKVQPPGKPAFTTQLFFPGQRLNTADPQFRPELLIAVTDAGGVKTGRFNIVLDL
jgi:protocatechuate 3,4-dioxygenase beta subunit